MIVKNNTRYYIREDGTVVEYPECLDVNVSLIEKINRRDCVKPVRLIDVLTTLEYKDRVEYLRSIDDEVKRKEEKSKLPAYNISGLYETLVKGAIPLKRNNLIVIDIDSDDNPFLDLLSLKEAIAKLPFVAAVISSVGGKGLFVIVLVEDPERGANCYRAVSKELKEQFGIVADSACNDVFTRMRFVSYDPNPLFNLSVKPFVLKETDIETYKNVVPSPIYTTDSTSSNFGYYSNSTDEYGRVLDVVKRLESENRDITDVQREWFEIGQSLANAFGEDGRELYHRVSRLSPTKYTPSDCDRMYTRCLSYRQRSTLSIATFYFYAAKRG